MAHFAKLNSNNVVVDINVVKNEILLDADGNESEQLGIAFLTEWSGGHSNWKQTSYNSNFRRKYAGVGDTYNADIDAFVPPQPHASWTLNEDSCLWDPPVAYPNDGKPYRWNENTTNWVEVLLEAS